MPKHEFMTPKAIANRIKSKGLQKLRWFCQMCQKQCRDENGFKCHTTSESHQRQLLLFAENPGKYLGDFSNEFLNDFMHLVKRRFGTKRVHANQVYQEYIADRNHLHMNATRWETLTGFVKFLGRTGRCVVDQTEKGWFISYIDRDPETLKRQETLEKKEKMKLDSEERNAIILKKQIKRGKERENQTETVYTECKKSEDEKVEFAFKPTFKKPSSSLNPQENALEKASCSKSDDSDTASVKSFKRQSVSQKRTAIESLIEEQESIKEKRNRKDYWLMPGIVVKIITKQLGEDYYKKKAVVHEVKDKYAGIVKVIESGDIVKLDQKHLESVIPAIGKTVLVVNGAYRGLEAILKDINPDKFCVKISINSGPLRGRIVENVQYEDISKLHSNL